MHTSGHSRGAKPSEAEGTKTARRPRRGVIAAAGPIILFLPDQAQAKHKKGRDTPKDTPARSVTVL
jgi:hypothetical protein